MNDMNMVETQPSAVHGSVVNWSWGHFKVVQTDDFEWFLLRVDSRISDFVQLHGAITSFAGIVATGIDHLRHIQLQRAVESMSIKHVTDFKWVYKYGPLVTSYSLDERDESPHYLGGGESTSALQSAITTCLTAPALAETCSCNRPK